jgi:hypothetical protein
MLTTFMNTLMSAEADAVCGAPFGESSSERTNLRNGYRHREFDTRAGTLDLAIPKLREPAGARACARRASPLELEILDAPPVVRREHPHTVGRRRLESCAHARLARVTSRSHRGSISHRPEGEVSAGGQPRRT